jgi:hypothetical protein
MFSMLDQRRLWSRDDSRCSDKGIVTAAPCADGACAHAGREESTVEDRRTVCCVYCCYPLPHRRSYRMNHCAKCDRWR